MYLGVISSFFALELVKVLYNYCDRVVIYFCRFWKMKVRLEKERGGEMRQDDAWQGKVVRRGKAGK